MKKLLVFSAVSAAIALTEAAVTVTGVNALQRWPWNGLVDVDFTIAGAGAGDVFTIDLSAEYAGGDKKIAAYTYTTEPIAGNGSHRITWNMGKDYPEFRAEDLCVSVTATPFSDKIRELASSLYQDERGDSLAKPPPSLPRRVNASLFRIGDDPRGPIKYPRTSTPNKCRQ